MSQGIHHKSGNQYFAMEKPTTACYQLIIVTDAIYSKFSKIAFVHLDKILLRLFKDSKDIVEVIYG